MNKYIDPVYADIIEEIVNTPYGGKTQSGDILRCYFFAKYEGLCKIELLRKIVNNEGNEETRILYPKGSSRYQFYWQERYWYEYESRK